jgi:hypothetical protein
VCKDINITECYVGQTTDFKSRKKSHKSNCNNANVIMYNYYVYQFIREHGNWENWDMIEIEKYPCNDSNEATKQERLRTEELHATLNSHIPSRTKTEYYQETKEQHSQNAKDYYVKHKSDYHNYYETNKEKMQEIKKTKITCICGSVIQKGDIKKHERTNKHIKLVKSIYFSV